MEISRETAHLFYGILILIYTMVLYEFQRFKMSFMIQNGSSDSV